MNSAQRIGNIILALLMIATAAFMVAKPEAGMLVVAVIISIAMSLNGLGSLLYYFRMARYSIGGKSSLYRGLIYLELGALTAAMSKNPMIYVIIYLAFLHIFNGTVDILRGSEAKQVGSPRWKFSVAYGVTDILIGVALIVTGYVMSMPDITVYVYAAGLVYSAIIRIIDAFRRTAIVYVQ